jgi:tetratricopeptide (TPR) repeat protein
VEEELATAEDETSSVRMVSAAERSALSHDRDDDERRHTHPPSARSTDDTRAERRAVRRHADDGANLGRGTDSLSGARAAFMAGNNAPAIALAKRLEGDEAAAALEVRATANLRGAREASRLCTAAILRFPLGAELYVLQASLLLDLRDYDAASQAARRLLYLDRSLVVAHLLLGSSLAKRGDREEAARAFRNARDLAAFAPSDDAVPFADGEKAGRLADFARAQIELLGTTSGGGIA